MATGSLALALLSLGVGPDTAPTAVMLDVGLVRVSPVRPGTQSPWDPATEKPKNGDGCEFFGLLGEAGSYSPAGHFAETGGKLVEALCQRVQGKPQGGKVATPTDPDLFVRLVASREVAYRSYTAHNTTSHVFHFQVAVPLDAIPTPGLQLYVQNDRGVGSDDSHEVIGSVRLHRKDLLAALAGDGVLRLDDESGGLDRIEIEVSNVEMPKAFEGRGDLSKFALFRPQGLRLPAGLVAEVRESGTYELDQLGTFTPAGRGMNSLSFPEPAFRNAPYGAGITVVGEGGHLGEYLVNPCALFVVTTPGEVLVGVNSRGRRSGTIDMQVQSRLATAEEWRTGKANGRCKALPQPTMAAADPANPAAPEAPETTAPETATTPDPGAWSASVVAAVQRLVQADGSNIALSIQRILHPTGTRARLQAFDYVPGPDQASFRFATSWRGGFGAQHVTTVVWEIGPQGHHRAALLSDTAEIKAGRENLQKLNSYFATKLYPLVTQNAMER